MGLLLRTIMGSSGKIESVVILHKIEHPLSDINGPTRTVMLINAYSGIVTFAGLGPRKLKKRSLQDLLRIALSLRGHPCAAAILRES